MTAEAKIIAIGLGANLNEPVRQIQIALEHLARLAAPASLQAASLYLTEPQAGPAGQDWYHNTVAIFETSKPASEIMTRLLDIEAQMGRVRLERWGPRVIDLDIILYGEEIIDEAPHLLVPHPRMSERRFVLAPLAEILPNWRHPRLNLTVSHLLQNLHEYGQEIKKISNSLPDPKAL